MQGLKPILVTLFAILIAGSLVYGIASVKESRTAHSQNAHALGDG
jgi:hypothetical protein